MELFTYFPQCFLASRTRLWLYLRMASANFRTGDTAHDGVSPYLVADEVADVLRVKPWQVVQLCRSGRLRATKPGKSWLIHRDDLAAYIASGSNDATPSDDRTEAAS